MTGRAAPPRARGRSITVSNAEIVRAAVAMLEHVSFDEFSVRELAKSLRIVPGTIYARYGTKDELLAQVYVGKIDDLADDIDALVAGGSVSMATLVAAIAPPLGRLRRMFDTHFDEHVDDNTVRRDTWRTMRSRFRRMIKRLYAATELAAAAEGVTLAGGTVRQRMLFTLLSSIDRPLTASTFRHRSASYERFVSTALLAALRADLPTSDDDRHVP